MKSPDSSTRNELIKLLRKHIDECVAARDDMTRTIEVLLETERELIQGDQPPVISRPDEPEPVSYRIHTPPQPERPSAVSAPPAFQEENPPHAEEAEEIILLGEDEPVLEVHPSLSDNAEEVILLEEDGPGMASSLPEEGPKPPHRVKKPILKDEELILEEDAYTLVPEQAKTHGTPPPPEFNSTDHVDGMLQEEQILLLDAEESSPSGGQLSPEKGVQDSRSIQKTVRPSLPFSQPFHPVEDLDIHSPAATGTRAASPRIAKRSAPAPMKSESAGAPIPATLQRLMDYIRTGGAVRCLDPWNQNCAAFLLSASGEAIFATDVFMNYLRKFLNNLHTLYRETAAQVASSSSNLRSTEELKSRKHFLASLVGALEGQRTNDFHSVSGLRISGRVPLPEKFEFEKSTISFIHAGMLNGLHELMQNPVDSFFGSGGPFFEIAEFLSKYKKFTHNLGEEQQARDMLLQLGMGEAPPLPGNSGGANPAGSHEKTEAQSLPNQPETSDDPPPPPEDTSSFMEEEKVRDLNTFDFDPDDKKSIMRVEEKALSSSAFKRIEQSSFQAKSPDTSSAEIAPDLGAISPAEAASSSFSSKVFPDPPQMSPEEDTSFDLSEFEKLLGNDETGSSSEKNPAP